MIKSTYAVFKNAEEKSLIYYPCPKNGNTSAKLFLAKHLGVEDKFIPQGKVSELYNYAKLDLARVEQVLEDTLNRLI